MDVAPLQPSDLLTLGGAAVLVTIIFKVIELALGLSPDQKGRFGPLLSVAIGIVLVTAAAVVQSQDVFAGAITGILAGWSASGLYDTATSVTSGNAGP